MRPLIFSGTTEGRHISERLSGAGVEHIVCVATTYGELVMQDSPYADVRMGRLTEPEMEKLIADEAEIVFDATHPYAAVVSENIRRACLAAGREYVRVLRGSADTNGSEAIIPFESAADCAAALKETEGNILLTTGSKELHIYASDPGVRDRLFVRVLPSEESIRLCSEAGIAGRQVIAMQGPFSKEMDIAVIRQFDIRLMVTKASGRTGGFEEKIEAAIETGIPVYLIGRPSVESGINVQEALKKYFGLAPKIRIDLVGIGPGRNTLMSEEARDAIRKAGIICGADRMIRPYAEKRKYPKFLAKDIIPLIERDCPERMAILFSGDTGFYSGAAKMKPALEEWLRENGYEYEIRIHPGISSFSYLAAAAGVSYSGAVLCSMHGRSSDELNLGNIITEIKHNETTVVIMSGPEDAVKLGREMILAGLGNCRVVLGKDLSYEEEQILDADAKACTEITEPGLYTALIINGEIK